MTHDEAVTAIKASLDELRRSLATAMDVCANNDCVNELIDRMEAGGVKEGIGARAEAALQALSALAAETRIEVTPEMQKYLANPNLENDLSYYADHHRDELSPRCIGLMLTAACFIAALRVQVSAPAREVKHG